MSEATKTIKVTNGVNVSNMMDTIEAINGNAEIAKFNFRATNRWINGSKNVTTVDDYTGACQEFSRPTPFTIEKDEPAVLLGTDEAPGPGEYALAALAGCMTTGIVYHAAVMGIEINEIESEYSGDLDLRGFLGLDESVRPGFQDLRVTFKIKSDATESQLAELIELSQKRSPVFDMFSNKVPVTVNLSN